MHFQPSPESLPIAESARRTALLYEDLGTIDPGLSFALRLGSEVGLDVGCPDCHAWLHQLESPAAADDLLRQALTSSYLILSIRGDTELSPSCREWLWEWLAGVQGDSSALIVLFDPQRSSPRPAARIRRAIEHMAVAASVNLFFHLAEPSDSATETADDDSSNSPANDESFDECFIGAIDAFGEAGDRLLGVA